MATAVKVTSQDVGDGELIQSDVTLSAAYAAGGETLTGRALGFRVGSRIDQVRATPLGGRAFEWVPDPLRADRGKLKVLGEPGDDFLLNRPGLTIGTGDATTVKVTNPITKSVAGVLAEVAAAEQGFTATTHDIAAGAQKIQEAIFLLSVQAGGAFIITKGATADEDLAVPPALPAGEAPMGTVKIKVAAGATDFDATTDDLDAAHLTTTFQDQDQEALEGTDLSGLTVRVTAEGR